MTSVRKQEAAVIKKEMIAEGICSMTLKVPEDEGGFGGARPGQFLLAYTGDGARLLGRPFCIADRTGDSVRIVFRLSGEGTRIIASKEEGDSLFLEGPLGNGYPEDPCKGKKKVLLAGGIGAPSLLYLAKSLTAAGTAAETTVVLGYRGGGMDCFLREDFEAAGVEVITATDDGSEGIKGNVIDALRAKGIKADIIYACGPMPMLSAVKAYGTAEGAVTYVSLEEHMACGVGVCLGCVTKTTDRDAHSGVKNARVCTEGPVFDAAFVDI